MRTVSAGTLLLAPLRATGGRAGDPTMGLFLMLLMAGATILLAWDLASTSVWSGLSVVHETMQTILVMAAVGTGSTGAVLWIGRPQAA